MPTELPEWLAAINKVLLDADINITETSDNWDLAEACDYLSYMHQMKTTLGLVFDSVSHIVSQKMGDTPEVTTSDGSKIEKKFASSRKAWQHKDLAAAVASRLNDMSIDIDTGEVVMRPEEIAEKMLDYVQPSYWRIRELGAIGINADMYCEVSEATESIIVRKAKK